MDGFRLTTKIWPDWFLFSTFRRLNETPIEYILKARLVGMAMYPSTRMGGEVLAEKIIHHFVAGELVGIDALS